VFITLIKNVYLGHKKCLTRNHPYRGYHVAFNGQPKHRFSPTQVTTAKFVKKAKEREV
jgi:hypothetical protein